MRVIPAKTIKSATPQLLPSLNHNYYAQLRAYGGAISYHGHTDPDLAIAIELLAINFGTEKYGHQRRPGLEDSTAVTTTKQKRLTRGLVHQQHRRIPEIHKWMAILSMVLPDWCGRGKDLAPDTGESILHLARGKPLRPQLMAND